MTDRRSEVPVWAWLNAQIMQEAFKSGALNSATHKIEKSYNLPLNSLRVINLGYLLSLLYCIIVVPKELWVADKLPRELEKVDATWLLGLASVTIKPETFDQDPVNRFFRHLRNAVAHARFEVNDQGDFTIWDQKNETSPRIFCATFSQQSLEEFLSKIGPMLANLHFSARE